ncbi:MAG: 50S ribosomal protein L35 [Magnetococcales bacterium]|jgi:large subunit ribosomal protein L35|nr:50S ribosomal protein L35 [Magnetococcales bacterium]|tara:strand:- start:334661 stop:334858 length:198 start_codon:yes stop_codon:yes gene_type:complete
MPKMKTKRSAAKRFKVTPNGKIKRAQAYHSHELSKMGQKAGSLAGTTLVSDADAPRIKRMLPYAK